MRTFLVVALLVIASTAKAEDLSRFQLMSAPDGRVFRMDKQTGKTVVLESTTYQNINEPGMPTLEVGKVYRIEDNQTVRYIGKGQFEPWGLDKYYKKE